MAGSPRFTLRPRSPGAAVQVTGTTLPVLLQVALGWVGWLHLLHPWVPGFGLSRRTPFSLSGSWKTVDLLVHFPDTVRS